MNRGRQKGTLIYYVFDLSSLDGKDLRELPLAKRKVRLERLLKNRSRLLYVDHVEGAGLAMFAGALGAKAGGCGSQRRQKPLPRRPPLRNRQTPHYRPLLKRQL